MCVTFTDIKAEKFPGGGGFIHRVGLISSSVSEVAEGGWGKRRSREEVSSKQIKATLYLLIWSDLKGSEGRRESGTKA